MKSRDLGHGDDSGSAPEAARSPGKRTLAQARYGTVGPSRPLPHADVIQRAFGRHDVSQIRAHVGGAAAEGAAAMGAEAYAIGDHVAFAGEPSLHTTVHEAAHVVQQRGGVQLAGGVGEAGDRYEEHADAVADAVVRGESVEALLDELAPGPDAGAAPAASVQQLVRLRGRAVVPTQYDAIAAKARALAATGPRPWRPAHDVTLRAWLTDRTVVYDADSVAALAVNLLCAPDDAKAWVGMRGRDLTSAGLAAGAMMRHRERLARLMQPATTPTTQRVPGLGNLRDEELLRLQHWGHDEEQFWMRPSEAAPQALDTIRRHDITPGDEAHITAAGDAKDPSYVVALDSKHLGHRYRGSGRATGVGHGRTYGSKRKREGYEYKGSGLVDGHAIQVQDDQKILGPFADDAREWKTKIARTDGSTAVYDDDAYLPEDEHDTRYIETHPHNFYWENQEQGKHMRQKAIEAPAMRAGTSFLHYNEFGSDSFQPHKGSATSHIYPVPARVHYLVADAKGGTTYYSADNRPVADYSNPSSYDPTTHTYGNVPSGVPSKSQNRNLGGLGAREHLEKARVPDAKVFPRATVLHPDAKDFTFEPRWRGQVAGYESPPPSPTYEPDTLAVEKSVVAGDQRRQRHFHHPGASGAPAAARPLVTDAAYDAKADRTALTARRPQIATAADLDVGADGFAKLLASAIDRLPAAATTTAAATIAAAAAPTTAATMMAAAAAAAAATPTTAAAAPRTGATAPTTAAAAPTTGATTVAAVTSPPPATCLAAALLAAAGPQGMPLPPPPRLPTTAAGAPPTAATLPAAATLPTATPMAMTPRPLPLMPTPTPLMPPPTPLMPPPMPVIPTPTPMSVIPTPTPTPTPMPPAPTPTPPTASSKDSKATAAASITAAATSSNAMDDEKAARATTPAGRALEDHQRALDRLAHALLGLRASLPADADAMARTGLATLIKIAQGIDPNDPRQIGFVRDVYTAGADWLRLHSAALRRTDASRRDGDPGSQSFSHAGNRIPSLRQFFDECGQMAVHNVLALDRADLAAAGAATALDRLGDFAQNIHEDDVRRMLARGGRADIPVISSMPNTAALLGAIEHGGALLGLAQQQQGALVALAEFRDLRRHVLNLVLNTGGHWIAVQLFRAPSNAISLVYLDSFDAPLDHSEVFDALRGFLQGVPVNVPAPAGAAATATPAAAAASPAAAAASSASSSSASTSTSTTTSSASSSSTTPATAAGPIAPSGPPRT